MIRALVNNGDFLLLGFVLGVYLSNKWIHYEWLYGKKRWQNV